MKYLLSGLSCGLVTCLSLQSIVLAKPPIINGIGNIQNTNKVQGAGCTLQRKGKKGYVFWSGFEKSALMNIDGKDRVLKLVGVNRSEPRVAKTGDRSTEIYKSGKITVRIDRAITRVCRKGDLECESTSYDGQMTLKIGEREQVVAVEGDCGS